MPDRRPRPVKCAMTFDSAIAREFMDQISTEGPITPPENGWTPDNRAVLASMLLASLGGKIPREKSQGLEGDQEGVRKSIDAVISAMCLPADALINGEYDKHFKPVITVHGADDFSNGITGYKETGDAIVTSEDD